MTFMKRTKDSDIMEGWAEFAAMQSTDDKDLYKVGDSVTTVNGIDYIIKELCGKNAMGVREYYVEHASGERSPRYITEREIVFGGTLPPIPTEDSEVRKCDHGGAYLNVISKSLQFWVCPNCGKEVDDPAKTGKKYLSQDEVDELLAEFEGMV